MVKEEDKITFEEYFEIFKFAVNKMNIKSIPSIENTIKIISTDRLNVLSADIVYIANMTDNMYPKISEYSGIITDNEKVNMKEKGITLSDSKLDRLNQDNIQMYNAITLAKERVIFSYHISNILGDSQIASIYLTKIKRRFLNLKEINIIDGINKDEIDGMSKKAILEKALSKYMYFVEGKEIEPEWLFLIYILHNESEEFRKIEKTIYDKNKAENLSIDILKKLYSSEIKTSISKIEEYSKCPFSYYLKYILYLKEEDIYELGSLSTGILLHDVLENIMRNIQDIVDKYKAIYDDKNKELESDVENDAETEEASIKEKEEKMLTLLEKEVEKYTEDTFNELLEKDEYAIFSSSSKFNILTDKFRRQIIEFAKYNAFALMFSEFRIKALEQKIHAKIKMDDDTDILIKGKIDRVDSYKAKNGKEYINVIDYKSSKKTFDNQLFKEGLNIQLITYLEEYIKGKSLTPSAALYLRIR